MNPWEENWRVIGRYANHACRIGVSPTKSIGQISDDARAALAVQAPAFARLLIRVLNDGSSVIPDEVRQALRLAGVDA